MKVVATGSRSRRASCATFSSMPKRRISTPTSITGERAARRRASTSPTQASSASGLVDGAASEMAGAHGASTMSRGSSIYTGREWVRQLRNTRAISSGARAASSRTTWSHVISRKMASCESSVMAWWCSR